jgi:hypothetical protein
MTSVLGKMMSAEDAMNPSSLAFSRSDATMVDAV